MKRALIIAAHPDDEVLGCGGFISKYHNKHVIFKVVFIGEGSTCRFSDPACAEGLVATSNRKNSALRALELFNISEDMVEFHDLPCGRFDQVPIIEINKIIENAIKEFLPDTVLTHSAYDANSDHKIVCNATIMATRPVNKVNVQRLMSYEVLSTSEWAFINAFTPSYFESLTESDVEMKWRSLAVYESEVKAYPFPRSSEGIKALAMMRGMQSGFKYAEAFQLIREFKQ